MQVWSHWGIALVTSLVSYLNTLVLYVIFRRRRRHGPLDEALLIRTLGVHALLAAVVGGCLFVLSQPLSAASGSLLTPARLLHLAGVVVAGGGVYLALGLLFKVAEVRAFIRLLKRAAPVRRGLQ